MDELDMGVKGANRFAPDSSREFESSAAYPALWRERELGFIDARRRAADLAGKRARNCQVGVAVSGGGIRSATLALGVFQALARGKLIRHIDYLSTVSGGGYFGSFLGALFFRAEELTPKPEPSDFPELDHAPSTVEVVEQILADRDHTVLRFLRRNGQYLAPSGSADKLLLGAVLLRNWLSVSFTIWTTLAFVALAFETAWLCLRLCSVGEAPHHQALAQAVEMIGRSGVSPWFIPGAALLLFVSVPLAWAYWFIGGKAQVTRSASALAWVALGSLVLHLAGCRTKMAVLFPLGLWLLAAVLAAFARQEPDGPSEDARLSADARGRHTSSAWLKRSLVLSGGIFWVALCDSVARLVYGQLGGSLLVPATYGLVGSVVFQEIARRAPAIGRRLTRADGQDRPAVSMNAWASLGAFVLMALMASLAFLIAQILARGGLPSTGHFPAEDLRQSAVALALGAVAVMLLGTTRVMLNGSSHLPLYSARLTRAFLGASNPARHRTNPHPDNRPDPGAATSPMSGDDLPAARYFGWTDGAKDGLYRRGGPLHLMNVTVNETVDRRTQSHEEDRRGIGMAVGPGGFSLGVRHHLQVGKDRSSKSPPANNRNDTFRVFALDRLDPDQVEESLSLGQWASISGAAFSTGLGARTRTAFSFFAGIFNIRLGYWWRAPAQPQLSALAAALTWPVWVQRYLFGELSARFPGTADPRWYLSDGGHFENMGAYELIRRELPIIVVLDGEADPNYQFEGLGNLVRKARIDFGAEIEFLGDPTLMLGDRTPSGLGPFSALRPHAKKRYAPAQAAIGVIRYQSGQQGQLLYVKASCFQGLPVDLAHYAAEHPAFPQEPTADQFFDEAQWESYRKLGDTIGERLFGGSSVLAQWIQGSEEAVTALGGRS